MMPAICGSFSISNQPQPRSPTSSTTPALFLGRSFPIESANISLIVSLMQYILRHSILFTNSGQTHIERFMLWLVPSHEAGHGAGYVTVWTRHVTHVTNVTWIYLYSSDHIYLVFIFIYVHKILPGQSRGCVSRLSGTREHVTNVTCSDQPPLLAADIHVDVLCTLEICVIVIIYFQHKNRLNIQTQ